MKTRLLNGLFCIFRNVIRLLELKVRDIEQAMLMKDIQYLQIIEALKEEIRVLEGGHDPN